MAPLSVQIKNVEKSAANQPLPDSPIISIRCQHNTRTTVSVAGDPCTMNSKQHQHHQHGYNDDALDVHANSLLTILGLVFFGFLGLARL